ncbi:unnamed protein product [Rhizophagus irregularis]|uniref:Uncharacterized protein n=1 Tax=Rhizophagus irregularis TaxID=588596 RepID=A0A915ZDT8_9GLOM|nr:unnamed protein product [Rhizophagus irregularis]
MQSTEIDRGGFGQVKNELNEANDGFIKELKLLRYNEDKNNSKTDDNDLIIPSNYQIINSRNENGKPSQLKTDDLTLHSDYQNLNSRITSSGTTKLNSQLNETGEPKPKLDKSQLRTGSFDQQSPHLNISIMITEVIQKLS